MSEKETQEYNPPKTGILVRNPTHINEARNAQDQREIIDALNESRANRLHAIYDYSKYNPKIPSTFPGLPGLLKLREMGDNEIRGFCASLMRVKPNIIGVILKLGNYENVSQYTGSRIDQLSKFNRPRNPTEVAIDLAALLSDKSLRIVEIQYFVNAASPGNFSVEAKAVATTQEEYNDDKRFCPYLEIEYFSI